LDDGNGQKAIDILSQVAELARVQTEANQLKIDELAIQRQEAENTMRELDMQAQTIALERERLNRAETRLQEFILRSSEQGLKMITLDDNFGETVQRLLIAVRQLIGAQIDVEKAVYALLTQNSYEIKESRLASPKRLERLRQQELLIEHQNTLHNLQLQQASYGSLDTPVKIIRQIEKEQEAIEELTGKIDE